ncbi:MAG TPA: 23S rRNA (guanosine(2251)-2'-O)-methyltransferase RlmB [Candidatus Paceibacterota bacterium]|nr:23S rRNA (guanosine(2251)-2'-O)-methyltransferase RlmB [Candidatus Paceibacterota bacterium]
MKSEKLYMYGKHALTEALAHMPQAVKKVFLAEAIGGDIRKLLDTHNIPYVPLKEEEKRQVAADAAHQGVIAVVDTEKLQQPFDTFINHLSVTADTCLVLLDELQDPHNVGAIIRSAAGFGATAVLIPEHNQAPITAAVIKTSAGMAFRIPLVRIGNVNTTLRALKEKGFWVYGLAMEGSKELGTESFDAPTVLVVGNEGEGIRQKTLELCDVTLRIPMHPRTESLNAAVSAAVVLYQWSTTHTAVLK